jgi:hypothetical protein
MDPNMLRDGSDRSRDQAGQCGYLDDRSSHENRQPEMSEPAPAAGPKSREPIFWLVPDTGDDIVVSRSSDY